ncbi:SNF2 family N-terminal domain-containing protein [Aspergillus leporis]|uniref:SNF2 family N-terminal domain-containing protein n=1 Tax=Aspergillus leporis TaxID=41062 RepID=A0A5N5XDN1_9EURO|nr:SNF2 family N-terminal domain-containing protein [Aspergillus leporis]
MDLIQALSGFIDGNHAASDQSLQDEIPVKTSDSPLAVSAVRSPYPSCNPPGSIVDKENFMEWWDKTWQDEAGPLHKVKFRRIILDEGQINKNYLSQISIAVRALTGRYKWILSGTPVLNRIEGFYPLLNFLGVPPLGFMTIS